MNKHLEQLIELSKIDKQIDEFGPRIKEIESKLRVALAKEEEILKKIEGFEEEIKDSKLKRSKNELHLAELADKLKELSKKSAIVKTDKEIKALQLEEEISKEQCEFANEEIERLDNIIESKQADIEEAKSMLEEVQKESTEIKASIEKEMTDIEKEREEVYSSKEKLVSKMSQKILTFYEKIRKWAGNTTVVPVRKQACYGCFMRINDKTYSSVIRADDIITCPHCGRILYKEVEEA
ncbi:zinc ribbon domain-containing protein [Sulfurospirillum sp. 1307]|jgi:predicted  nucleic acid-binding Zn-ribbon protein